MALKTMTTTIQVSGNIKDISDSTLDHLAVRAKFQSGDDTIVFGESFGFVHGITLEPGQRSDFKLTTIRGIPQSARESKPKVLLWFAKNVYFGSTTQAAMSIKVESAPTVYGYEIENCENASKLSE